MALGETEAEWGLGGSAGCVSIYNDFVLNAANLAGTEEVHWQDDFVGGGF